MAWLTSETTEGRDGPSYRAARAALLVQPAVRIPGRVRLPDLHSSFPTAPSPLKRSLSRCSLSRTFLGSPVPSGSGCSPEALLVEPLQPGLLVPSPPSLWQAALLPGLCPDSPPRGDPTLHLPFSLPALLLACPLAHPVPQVKPHGFFLPPVPQAKRLRGQAATSWPHKGRLQITEGPRITMSGPLVWKCHM